MVKISMINDLLGSAISLVSNSLNEFFKAVPPTILLALVLGLAVGYAIGRFFGEDLAEGEIFDYLSGKSRLRK